MNASASQLARPAAWTGVLAAVYGLVSLAAHAGLLTALGLVPGLVRLADLEVRRAALAQGGGAEGRDPEFQVVYDAFDAVLPLALTSLGVAVLLGLTIVILGAATTFGKRALARLLPWVLVAEAVRGIGWAALASLHVGPRLHAASVAFDTATATLTARGAGVEETGVAEVAAVAFSPTSIWIPAAAHALVLTLLALLAKRALHRRPSTKS